MSMFHIVYVFSIIDLVPYFPNLELHGHTNCLWKTESMEEHKEGKIKKEEDSQAKQK